MTIVWIGAGLLVGLAVGWMIGAGRRPEPEPDPVLDELRRLEEVLATGSLPAPGEIGPGVEGVRRALDRGWTTRNAGREEALKQALGRIAAFVDASVKTPLIEVRDGDLELLKEGVGRALGGIRDLEFFLRDPITPDETHNIVPIVQAVVKDFISDWEVSVRFAAPATPVRAHIHKGTFLDAVYLLLHNAGHFSDWATVDVTVEEVGPDVRISIRDRGPGFSPEALERARDLFFTTKPEGLGLGIPFARRIIEGFGGHLEIGNREGGGAEVAVVLPRA